MIKILRQNITLLLLPARTKHLSILESYVERFDDLRSTVVRRNAEVLRGETSHPELPMNSTFRY